MRKIHYFETTGDAYDACQCDEKITNGDLLVIVPEKVVGIADTWPIAVTENHGVLHRPKEGYTVGDVKVDFIEPAADARELIAKLGW